MGMRARTGRHKKNKVIGREPCPVCRSRGADGSGDNLAVYDDGHVFCFSCNYFLKDNKISLDNSRTNQYNKKDIQESYGVPTVVLRSTQELPELLKVIKDYRPEVSRVYPEGPTEYYVVPTEYSRVDKDITLVDYSYQYLGTRGISRETMEFFRVLTKVSKDGQPVAISFPYGTYEQVRKIPGKQILTIGDSKDVKLFGQDQFNPGSAKTITICEGAYDAMSVCEIMGRYPAVSVRSASCARADCERAHNYLNSFERIYLCFDNDRAGTEAAREVSQLFDINKVYHVKLEKWKDANEALEKGDKAEFTKTWWNAKRYQPKGIVSTYEQMEEILKKESAQAVASYPFPTLESMAYGIRSGELVLFTALEKVGKTEVIRAIEHHLLKTTEENIGIIHLEELEKRSVQGLVGIELGAPVHLPDAGVSVEDQITALKSLTKKDGRLHFYSHFGSDDPDSILGVIRYLVGVNHCKYIFLDHITMLVTGFEDEDERKKLDYISTRLAMLTRELNFTLFLVSHVNDSGQTRGSRNIAKVADLIVHLDRNIEAADSATRNQTALTCRGNRYAGITGPAGVLHFDSRKFTLSEKVEEEEKSSEPVLF